MQEAVGRFVPGGASVCMGTALEALIPFAAGHVRCNQAAWVGNVSAGLGHNHQRAVALGPEAREAVRVKTPRLSEPLDYGA
jgi:hypothetical protein